MASAIYKLVQLQTIYICIWLKRYSVYYYLSAIEERCWSRIILQSTRERHSWRMLQLAYLSEQQKHYVSSSLFIISLDEIDVNLFKSSCLKLPGMLGRNRRNGHNRQDGDERSRPRPVVTAAFNSQHSCFMAIVIVITAQLMFIISHLG